MKKIGYFKPVLIIFVLLIFSAGDVWADFSDSVSVDWQPSSENDGVATRANVVWKISRWMGVVTVNFSIDFDMYGTELYLDGKKYSKAQLGVMWEKISVLDTSYVLETRLYVPGYALAERGTLNHAFENTAVYLSERFADVDNKTLQEIYENSMLSLDQFKLTKLEFGGLYEVRSYIRRLEEQKKELDSIYEDADAFFRQSNWASAVRYYQKAIDISPEDYRAREAGRRIEISNKKIEQEKRKVEAEKEAAEREIKAAEAKARSEAEQREARQYQQQQQDLQQQMNDFSRQAAGAMSGIMSTFDYAFISVGPALMLKELDRGYYKEEPQTNLVYGICTRYRGGWYLEKDIENRLAMCLGVVIGGGLYTNDQLVYRDYKDRIKNDRYSYVMGEIGGGFSAIAGSFEFGFSLTGGFALGFGESLNTTMINANILFKFKNFYLTPGFSVCSYDEDYEDSEDNAGLYPRISLGIDF